jgi:hypothetical protein
MVAAASGTARRGRADERVAADAACITRKDERELNFPMRKSSPGM